LTVKHLRLKLNAFTKPVGYIKTNIIWIIRPCVKKIKRITMSNNPLPECDERFIYKHKKHKHFSEKMNEDEFNAAFSSKFTSVRTDPEIPEKNRTFHFLERAKRMLEYSNKEKEKELAIIEEKYSKIPRLIKKLEAILFLEQEYNLEVKPKPKTSEVF